MIIAAISVITIFSVKFLVLSLAMTTFVALLNPNSDKALYVSW